MSFKWKSSGGFMDFFGIFMIKAGSLKLECLSSSEIGQYMVQAAGFPAVVLLHVVVGLISRVFPQKYVADPRKIFSSLITINQGLLITFAHLSLAAFQCF